MQRHRHRRLRRHAASDQIRTGPQVLDEATGTLYVPGGANDSNRVAVVNAAICNATDTASCGQHPGVVKAGGGTCVLAVSQATNTVYGPGAAGNPVAVINGGTCNAISHAGCGHQSATAKVGVAPLGVAVDDQTRIPYMTNNANGDSPEGTSCRHNAGAVTTAGSGLSRFSLIPQLREGWQ
jgi:hypothetical protein